MDIPPASERRLRPWFSATRCIVPRPPPSRLTAAAVGLGFPGFRADVAQIGAGRFAFDQLSPTSPLAAVGWLGERVGGAAGRVRGRVGAVTGWIGRLRPMLRFTSGTDEVSLTPHRDEQSDAVVLFVHGFAATEATWGRFPEVLADTPSLAGWDVYSLGYRTGLAPDIGRVWAADPSIELLATFLRTQTQLAPLDRYRSLAVVGHSMGGLVVQRALVDDPGLVSRVSHVFLFGSPSAGLVSARWGRFLKTQITDMAAGGPFITDLRSRWDEEFGRQLPFQFFVVAGDRDVFVPPTSSLDPFPTGSQLVVPGNHMEIAAVTEPDSMSVQVVVEGIVGDAAPGGPWNAARVAVERREFRRAVKLLQPHAAELDERHLVELALALDEIGDRDEAIATLGARSGAGTDAQGTLAGRLKRNWFAEGRRDDAESALELYSDGYEAAGAAGDDEQASYHGINVAFLQLVFAGNVDVSREWATKVLAHCSRSEPGHWRSATDGEARLYLGEFDRALESYRAAVAAEPTPRELESMYVQASWVVAQHGDRELQEELDTIFRPAPS